MGVRARATLVAVVAVAIALAAGSVILLQQTGERIESSIRAAASARAEALGALIGAGALVDPLPGQDPELFAQVVDPSGDIVASDRTVAGLPALVDVSGSTSGVVVYTIDDVLEGFEDREAGLEDEGPYAVAVLGVSHESGPLTVVVAASMEDAAQARNAIRPVLGLGLPALLALVAGLVWVLTGRALRPVADMSDEAARISSLALDRRLPVPAARDELQQLALTLNEMLARLEESSLKQRRFVSDASHELKSPLASIRTIAEVAGADGRLDDEAAADIAAEVARMQSIVTDLLYLARHDEHPGGRVHEDVDLDQVVGAAVASASASGTPFFELSVSPTRVFGDVSALERMVRNLIDNARRHARSRVWVEVRHDGARARLVVEDDGPGIPESEAVRIFDRFVRLDESRARDTGGAGLGLAVVAAVAADHGGSVEVHASRHGGAAFAVTMPAKP